MVQVEQVFCTGAVSGIGCGFGKACTNAKCINSANCTKYFQLTIDVKLFIAMVVILAHCYNFCHANHISLTVLKERVSHLHEFMVNTPLQK